MPDYYYIYIYTCKQIFKKQLIDQMNRLFTNGSGRPGFNPMSSFTKGSKNGT